MSWDSMDALQHGDFGWPDVSQVVEFRAQVKTAVIAAIEAMPHPRDVPITMASPYWALVMAFEHERIHLETSSVLIRQLPIDSVLSLPGWRHAPTYASSAADAPANRLIDIEAGTAVIGKPRDFPSFGWDNEYGMRTVPVPAFRTSAFLVSNAEFLPFVTVRACASRLFSLRIYLQLAGLSIFPSIFVSMMRATYRFHAPHCLRFARRCRERATLRSAGG